MILTFIPKLIQYLIKEKEFFIYPYKKMETLLDISLHKQLWFSHFFIDFIDGETFFNFSLDDQKRLIDKAYREIKLKNKFKKIYFYKIIITKENNPHLEELYQWLKEENMNIHLLIIHLPSKGVSTLFSNFKDHENIKGFLKENIDGITDNMEEIDLLEIERKTKKEKGYYFENKKSYITKSLISMNIIFFLYMSIIGSTTNISDLIQFGAKFNPLIADGEYYRLLSNIFIHIGIVHLLFNTYALNILGKDIEFIYGPFKFLFIYLIAGLFGSLGSFLFSNAVSAGASGAIFGLMGAYIYFGIRNPAIFSARYGMNLISLLGINIVFGLMNPNIDNFAHLGGFIGGFLASLSLGIKDEKFFKVKNIIYQFLIFSLIGILLFTGIFIHKQSWEYHLHSGIKYLEQEDFYHAQTQFERGLKINPNISEFYFYLAYIYYQKGNRELSIQYLQKTLSIDPNHTMAKNFLNNIK